MKTLILTTAAALMLAGPLAAATPAELANAQFAKSHETGDGARYDAGFTPSATAATIDQALILFAGDDDGEGDRRILSNVDSGMIVSTSNASSDAAAFAKAHLATTDEDKR